MEKEILKDEKTHLTTLKNVFKKIEVPTINVIFGFADYDAVLESQFRINAGYCG